MSDLTREELAELRRLLDEAKRRLSSPRRAGKAYAMGALLAAAVNALPALLDAAAERDALAAKLDAVRALHQPAGRHNFCGTCAYAPWPCATYRALDGGAER